MDDMLSNESLDDLERKRQAATPGPWKHDNRTKPQLGADPYVTTLAEEVVAAFSLETPDDKGLSNLDYIAAANPEAVGKLIAEVKASRAATGDGLNVAAEFFEAMDASGDREPLTPSAIACLLREYAADRRGHRQGHAGTPSPTEERQARVHHAGGKAWLTAKEFADGTRLLQREDGTFILPPESEWPTFFERIWESEPGTMGLKGGHWFLLKPKEKP